MKSVGWFRNRKAFTVSLFKNNAPSISLTLKNKELSNEKLIDSSTLKNPVLFTESSIITLYHTRYPAPLSSCPARLEGTRRTLGCWRGNLQQVQSRSCESVVPAHN